uniref:Cell differentiation protein RCD1 homolog n=1 Tax=Nicotiana tabacum TaxID=4097 RepID=A0A1S3ZPX4_TOBAC|nr:PREDICTED: cell differentiation protein RCD1 homolog [Nicotiana tabacum]
MEPKADGKRGKWQSGPKAIILFVPEVSLFMETALTSTPTLPPRNNISSSSQKNEGLDLASATPKQLVLLLHDVNLREEVINQLTKEVIAVYPKLSTSMISIKESTRVCNALALFQCMGNHQETRRELIKAKIPFYFYPFLKTNGKNGNDKPLEFIRLTSLGVIGSLTKFDDPYGGEVLYFFLETELVPLCLHCMDLGDELSRKVLHRVVEKLSQKPCILLLRYVIQSYLCLSQVSRPSDAFRSQIPCQLFDNTFMDMLRDDPETSTMLQQLYLHIMR